MLTVILDNGASALVREREDIATLKRLSEKLYQPLVRYIGQSKVTHGALAGTLMHTVELPGGTMLCYPSGEGFPEASEAEPWGVPSGVGTENVPKKYRISKRRGAMRERNV